MYLKFKNIYIIYSLLIIIFSITQFDHNLKYVHIFIIIKYVYKVNFLMTNDSKRILIFNYCCYYLILAGFYMKRAIYS